MLSVPLIFLLHSRIAAAAGQHVALATTPARSSFAGSASRGTGQASWYPAPSGTCASLTLDFGTVVTVTNPSNGASTTCVVDDRGPYPPGRIIDLSEGTFSELASRSTGVIEVRLQW